MSTAVNPANGANAAGLRFVDVSGVGNSGKSAAVDLLREIDGIWAPDYWFEFDLLRVPGGLIDLRTKLVADWSPVRSHAAVHAFRDVVHKMGADPAWWDLWGQAQATSQRYDRRFRGKFIELSERFVDSLVAGSYRAEWPYSDLAEQPLLRLGRKVLRRTGLRRWLTREVLLVDGADFDQRAAAYLTDLYRTIVPPETGLAVMNNAFEPFNPVPFLDMLPGSRQIVITRDPRDMYVSGLNAHRVTKGDRGLLAVDNDGMNKSFLATDDLSMFVKRYRLYHDHLYAGSDPRVLRLRFEDLVGDYERAVPRIRDFLGVASARHARPKSAFDPQRSAANIGIWRRYSGEKELRYIEAELDQHLASP